MTRAERVCVWGGGAMFVASLALCTWWYLFHLGQRRPPAGMAPLVYDATLVAVFAIHHSAFARDSIKRRLTPIPAHLRRSVYVWTASVLLSLVCLLWRTLGGDLYDAAGARGVGLVVVQLAGLALIARSAAHIDPLELAGIRPPGDRPRSGSSTRPPGDALQIRGPYRLVRHPLYLGWMLAVFATPHMTGDRLAFAVLTSVYLVIAIRWEERSLAQSFGDVYTRYRQQVRWRVIPFIY